MPRFVRELPDNGKEILSMNEVLKYLIEKSVPLIRKDQLEDMVNMSQYEWQSFADEVKVCELYLFYFKKPTCTSCKMKLIK